MASGRPVLFSSNRSRIPNAFIRRCARAFRTSSIPTAMNAKSSWGRARLGGFARLARIASVLGTKDSLHLSYAHCRTLGPKGVLNSAPRMECSNVEIDQFSSLRNGESRTECESDAGKCASGPRTAVAIG